MTAPDPLDITQYVDTETMLVATILPDERNGGFVVRFDRRQPNGVRCHFVFPEPDWDAAVATLGTFVAHRDRREGEP